jgi:hypothetical protein
MHMPGEQKFRGVKHPGLVAEVDRSDKFIDGKQKNRGGRIPFCTLIDGTSFSA